MACKCQKTKCGCKVNRQIAILDMPDYTRVHKARIADGKDTYDGSGCSLYGVVGSSAVGVLNLAIAAAATSTFLLRPTAAFLLGKLVVETANANVDTALMSFADITIEGQKKSDAGVGLGAFLPGSRAQRNWLIWITPSNGVLLNIVNGTANAASIRVTALEYSPGFY